MIKSIKVNATILIISFLMFFSCFVYSQYPYVRNFSRKISNSGSQNWKITQGENNWMYFANNNGLLEFDGNEWEMFPIENYTNVRSVLYDPSDKRIYAGAYNEFGYYQRNSTGILLYTSLSKKINTLDKKFNVIWNICKQGDVIYFSSDNYIFQYRKGKISFYKVKDKITSMAVVNGYLFIATDMEGAFIFNGSMLMQLPDNKLLKNKKICAILAFQSKILFVTEFDGIFQFEKQLITKLNTDIDSFLSENQVFCATIQDDNIAIGTVRNGVVAKNLTKNTTIYSNIKTGLQNNTILSISFDILGNLWLGLDKGIDFLCYNSSLFDVFGNNNNYGAGYASIYKNNYLFLGTNQGLYKTKYPFLNSDKGFLMETVENIKGQIWNLCEIDNHIFCGADHGAFVYENTNLKKFPQATGTWGFKVFPKKPEYILASSYKGFFLLKKTNGIWSFYKDIVGFNENGCYFEIDNESRIWFSHWRQGVYCLTLNELMDSIVKVELFDSTKGLPIINNNRVLKINGKIVVSAENGYYNFEPIKNKMIRNDFLKQLFGTSKWSMNLYESKNNDIWKLSNSQISRAIYQGNGTYRIDSAGFAMLKGKLIPGFEHINSIDSNTVLIGNEDGFSMVNLKNNKKNNDTLFNVVIKNVYLTKCKDSLVNCVVNNKKLNIAKFKSFQNSIRFEFSATEFRKEDAITYNYMLVGFDHGWSDFTTIRTKEYTNLKKGTYVFRVRAKNDCNYLETETEYKFVILPAWYESLWAWIFYIFLSLILIYLISKYLQRKSEIKVIGMKELKEKEMREQEERFMDQTKEKEKEIFTLKNQKLQYELRNKSQDLASSTMNLIRKNEILLELNRYLDKIEFDILNKKDSDKTIEHVRKMQTDIKKNILHDNSWKKFQENFDMVYENYLKRLGEQYPELTVSDKKLSAYLKMNLSSKEIAPLMNMSYRSVEMSRYRLRKKLNLSRETNLTDFLQKF